MQARQCIQSSDAPAYGQLRIGCATLCQFPFQSSPKVLAAPLASRASSEPSPCSPARRANAHERQSAQHSARYCAARTSCTPGRSCCSCRANCAESSNTSPLLSRRKRNGRPVRAGVAPNAALGAAHRECFTNSCKQGKLIAHTGSPAPNMSTTCAPPTHQQCASTAAQCGWAGRVPSLAGPGQSWRCADTRPSQRSPAAEGSPPR